MTSRQLTFAERRDLEKYLSMSTNELVRDLNFSLLPKSNSESIDEMLRGRFFLLSDIKTILHPTIVSSRTTLLLSEVRQVFQRDWSFIDSLEKTLAQQPSEEALITFIYDFLDKNMDYLHAQLSVATYICRVGVKEFLT